MANRYWVGGTADWDATAGSKWATTSGGSGGASVPTASDDVFFDASSGAVVVSVAAESYCKSINFTGFTGTFTGSDILNVGTSSSGNFTLSSSMTFSFDGTINFVSTTTGNQITTNGKTITALYLNFTGAGGYWTLQDNLTTDWYINLVNGTLNTNAKTVNCTGFVSSNTNTRSLIRTGSAFYLTSFDTEDTTNLTSSLFASSLHFNGNGGYLRGGSSTIGEVVINDSEFSITGSNYFYTLDIQSGSGITFETGSTNTIEGFTAYGTSLDVITIGSSVPTETYYLEVTLYGDTSYVNVTDSTATGDGTPIYNLGGIDGGNNAVGGWDFVPDVSDLTIDLNDAVAITESVSEVLINNVIIDDNISLVENLVILNTIFINTNDSISLSESNNVDNSLLQINVNEEIITSEILLLLETNNITVFDNVALNENLSHLLIDFINLSDSISIDENVFELLSSNINVTDNLLLIENVDLLDIMTINVSDVLNLTDSSAVENTTLNILAVDLVLVDENSLTTTVNDIYVNVADDLVVEELVFASNLLLSISSSDDISTTEDVLESITIYINVFDSISLEENNNIDSFLSIFTNDNLVLSESVFIPIDLYINLSNNISASDTLYLENHLANISVSDEVHVEELNLFEIGNFFYINVHDNISYLDVITAINKTQDARRVLKLKSSINNKLLIKSKIYAK